MPSAATTAPAEPTRDALVRVAGELLERDGLGAVTLREVGGRAGVSRSAPYRHFAGKEALLAAVAAADLRALGAEGAAAGASARRPIRRLERMLGTYLAFAPATRSAMTSSTRRRFATIRSRMRQRTRRSTASSPRSRPA